MIQERLQLITVLGQIFYSSVIGKANAADIRKRKICVVIRNKTVKSVLRRNGAQLTCIGFHDGFRPADFVLIVKYQRTSVKIIGDSRLR